MLLNHWGYWLELKLFPRSLAVQIKSSLHFSLLVNWLVCTYSQCVATTKVRVTWSDSNQSAIILNLQFGKYFENTQWER